MKSDIDPGLAIQYIGEEVGRLAAAVDHVARAIDRLGNADAATPMGAIEGLGTFVRDGSSEIASALSGVGEAIERIKE